MWLAGVFALALAAGALALTMGLRGHARPASVAVVDPEPAPKVVVMPEPMVDAKNDAEAERRRQLFTHLMIDGGIATQLKQFDQAVAAYADALKIFPDDNDTQRKLDGARDSVAAEEKVRLELEQVQSDAAALVKRGQDAFDKEQFAAAIDFFKLALMKAPTNEEAAGKLLRAQERLQIVEAEKKNLDQFDQHILAGKAALQAGRAGDAIREFVAAGKILPNDPLPAELVKAAEKQLVPVKNVDDRKKQYQLLLDQGNGFLRMKNNEEAEDVFRQALKLYPTDVAAQRGLESAQTALKKSRGDVARLMAQAQNAIAVGQIGNAMVTLRSAQAIMPNNLDLLRALRIAELIQLNQAAYYQAINRAAAAMNLRRYGDAILAYSDALAIVPTDPLATIGLAEAQRDLANFNRKKIEYDGFVKQGVAFLQSQRYREGAQALDSAVKMMRPPYFFDAQVQSLARYAEAMAQGNAALNARQYPQAAQFFQLALNEIPSDLTAQNGLQQARLGGKSR